MTPEQFKLFARIEETHWWFVARRGIVQRVINHLLTGVDNANIVDIGCGTGANIASLMDRYSCVGVDLSQDAVSLARERYAGAAFIQSSSFDDLPEGTLEGADLVLLMDVIEHVADDFEFVSDLLRRMKPGAWLLITVPADMALWSPHDTGQGHYRRYDRHRFTQVWQGIDAVSERFVSHFNTRLYPIVRAVRWLNRFLGRSSGDVNMDFTIPKKMVNNAMRLLFFGEVGELLQAVHGTGTGYKRGVSLMAALQREPGDVAVRRRPDDVAPDPHIPDLPDAPDVSDAETAPDQTSTDTQQQAAI
jgi:SAM-dependent methyltransferase